MQPTELEIALKDVSLEKIETDGEEQLLALLAERIAHLLDTNPDLLFSTLYRLDIYESKINRVLKTHGTNTAEGLAKLVLDRQKEKLLTREKYGSPGSVDWDMDLE